MICTQEIYGFQWNSWSNQSSYREKLRCHVCDGRTDGGGGKWKIGQCSGRPETAIEIQNLFCTVFIDGKGAGSLRRILSTIWSCALVMQALLWPWSLVIYCVVNRPAFPRHLLLDNPLVTLQTELLICSFIIIASSSLLLLRSIKQENIHNSSFLTFSIRHPLKLKGKKFTCNLFDMKSCCNLSGAT